MISFNNIIEYINSIQFKKDYNKLQFFNKRCLYCYAKDCNRTEKEMFQCGMNKY